MRILGGCTGPAVVRRGRDGLGGMSRSPVGSGRMTGRYIVVVGDRMIVGHIVAVGAGSRLLRHRCC